jgi:hypothetical protein
MTGTTVKQNHTPYLLIGNGKLATHLKYYLQSQNIFLKQWSRSEGSMEELVKLALQSKYILICTSDSAIESIYSLLNKHLEKPTRFVHFSGSFHHPDILSFHPLMSFTSTLLSIQDYKKIPFIGIHGQDHFQSVFPSLENPSFQITADQKSYYHSLCMMANNFTVLLWQKAFKEFESQLNLPKEVLLPIMQRTFQNLLTSPTSSLTGPLARGDLETINKNLAALKSDQFKDIYISFIRATLPNSFAEMNKDFYERS